MDTVVMAALVRTLKIPVGHEGRRTTNAGHTADRDGAERSPGEVRRGRAVGGLRRRGHAHTRQTGDQKEEACGSSNSGQTDGRHQVTRAHQEQGPGDDPPVGPGPAGHHAHRLADRAIGGGLQPVRDQPGPGEQNGGQPCRNHRPGGNGATGTHRPGQPAPLLPGDANQGKLHDGRPTRSGICHGSDPLSIALSPPGRLSLAPSQNNQGSRRWRPCRSQ